ncbi:MAG: T9SS type A sorting domain-containing protein [Flavobacteriales bacterium]|nr:T9SS type A sorting domain-containing protein [Flavobacteriales bacterium]
MKTTISTLLLFTAAQLCFSQFTPLHLFDQGVNGANSYSTLINDGTYVYGTTAYGISANKGTIFRMMVDGSGFETLHEFTGYPDGHQPVCGLYSDGTWLYGTTRVGGVFDAGAVYKIKSDGSEYQVFYSFEGLYEGLWPEGSVISDGIYIYGMTNRGGDYSKGLIYRVMPDGTGYETLHEFDGANTGKYPHGALLFDGTWMYGLTQLGGVNDDGVIFRIMPDGTGYEKLFDFEMSTSGGSPHDSFLMHEGWLYSLNFVGGTNGNGTLFKIQPDGNNFTVLLNFESLTTGRAGISSPITDGTYLYGMTQLGGTYDNGVIFSIKPDGTDFLKLFEFQSEVTGYSPSAGLLMIDNFVYGASLYGAENGGGLLFKFQYQPQIAVNDSNFTTIDVYPNPANDFISIQGIASSALITVVDITGKIVLNANVVQNRTLNISSLDAGIYMISITQDGINVTKKIVVE